MTATEQIALDSLTARVTPEEIARHGFPKPKNVVVSKGIDSDGEEAFHIYLIFPNDTPEKNFAWKKIEPMVSWVRDLFWTDTGSRLWPYVRVVREEQLHGSAA